MSHFSDKADQRKVEPNIRMGAEPQPGPSRCQPSRQGYCGYCRVLYRNLDQHLSSLRHLDSVRASSRGSSTVSSASSSRTKLTLLERFLQDVLEHHPHRYKDPRPSHADLPSVSAPLLPREELDELCFSDKDSQSQGTRERLPSSDVSHEPTNQQDDTSSHSQSGERISKGAGEERQSAPIREQKEEGTLPTQTPPSITQAPPPLHRKAHRKTNRRKTSNSSSSSPPHRVSGPAPLPPQELGPSASCPDPGPPSKMKPSVFLGLGTGPGPPSGLRPWASWQKERREALKEEAFSSDHSDPMDRTIEEVIQMCCYGVTSTPRQQEEAESFHLSIPLSAETQSDDWDSPVQRGLTESITRPPHTPVQVSQTKGRDLSRLMDVQVELEDQVYSYQLDSALQDGKKGGGAKQDQGFLTLPIDEILPVPQHIPESFKGKTWAQVELEDEDKVDRLVRQFRGEKFVCYFDSESLARYGRRSRKKEGADETKDTAPHMDILPLLDHDEEDSVYLRRRRRRKGRGFRVASRCQVVKVSHGTQTIRLVVPAVRQPVSEDLPPITPAANQDATERTPEAQTWRCLPSSYSSIVTPLQPRTSVVYLLCSPSGPAPTDTPVPESASKRCRKKKRPLDLQRSKVKYKRFPVKFYDPVSNRILKNPPKGFLRHRGSASSSHPPPCVRQLFRSLSPDLNTDRPSDEADAGSSRAKGQRLSDISHTHSSRLSALSRDSTQSDKQDPVRGQSRTSLAPSSSPQSLSERGRGGRRNRTRLQTSKKRARVQATPPHPRREGLRRAGPTQPPPSQKGRGRRGRGLERSRR
ncbi:DBF4-type zinc finger-containing protein 2 isoform X4 [Xyrichtys novacula]|uniref:DBF4-type zinc finger-containing protein 2 isoform X4 n=1 Tax=Xyrichtys novacula TaxID=13765 RepID=A0AAV1HN90_XYRNO|nr:DBF4-type zinc finger-containing protein 2 isoform X4 [Xyrichtys novacula]